MEKYKYSSLTDEQHEKIVEKINRIKTEHSDGAAEYIVESTDKALWHLFCLRFITSNEMNIYREAITEARYKRKETRHGNLSEQ